MSKKRNREIFHLSEKTKKTNSQRQETVVHVSVGKGLGSGDNR